MREYAYVNNYLNIEGVTGVKEYFLENSQLLP